MSLFCELKESLWVVVVMEMMVYSSKSVTNPE
jgi:hypothetical protein